MRIKNGDKAQTSILCVNGNENEEYATKITHDGKKNENENEHYLHTEKKAEK